MLEVETIQLLLQIYFYGNCAIDTVNVSIPNSITIADTTIINTTICADENFIAGGVTHTTAGTYNYTLATYQGCDSTVILNLIVNSAQTTILSETICEGESFIAGGVTHTTTGTYNYTLSTYQGCDSVVTLNLIVNPTESTVLNETICEGESFTAGGIAHTIADTYSYPLSTYEGCDSTVTLNLTVNPTQTTVLNETICAGESFIAGGVTHTTAGTYNYTFATYQGCDSTVILNLIVNSPQSIVLNENLCEGDTLVVNGINHTTAGTYNYALQTVEGCDSNITLNLSIPTEICDNGIDDDCDGFVDEFDTECNCDDSNFFGQCEPPCETDVVISSLGFQVDWTSEDNVPNYQSPWVADIDNDGVPEVIIQSVNSHKTTSDRSTKDIHIMNGQDGTTELTITTPYMPWGAVGPIAIADIDNDGYGEIIISTTTSYNGVSDQGYLICYEHDGTQKWKSNVQVGANAPKRFGSTVGIADFNADGISEVFIYNEIFNAQTGVLLADGGSNGMGMHSNSGWGASAIQVAADLTSSTGLELACGNTVYEVTITNTSGTSGNTMTPINLAGGYNDGYSAVADIDLDGELDVVVSEFGSAGNARVYVWNPRTNSLIASTAYADFTTTGYNFTGPAFIGDMDDDCQPEIGFTRSKRVYAYDYNNTTTLQQKWSLTTSDVSGLTGITMFDFNNDGQQELVYRDETQLRVLDGSGSTATNLFSYGCTSGTALEMPTVADVDGDNQAEICVSCQTIGGQKGNVIVFETDDEPWAYARQVWNQYAYNATNINDDLTVPKEPQNTAVVYQNDCGCNGESRPLNSHLVQATSLDDSGCPIYAVPDALILDVVNNGCVNNELVLAISIVNQGSNPLPAGADIAFYHNNPEQNGSSLIMTSTISNEVQPNDTLIEYFTIDISGYSSTFDLYIVINDDGSAALPLSFINDFPTTGIAECDYANNVYDTPITVDFDTTFINLTSCNPSDAGTVENILSTQNGCDSLVITTTTLLSSQTTTLNETICEGESFTAGGISHTTAGTYNYTLATYQGCDSTVTLNLIVNPTQTTVLNETICEGESFTAGGISHTTAGTYNYTLATYQGCDSTVTLNLIVTL